MLRQFTFNWFTVFFLSTSYASSVTVEPIHYCAWLAVDQVWLR